ncbi:MAG TPA: enhanced serine sensitivity protein SseB C-terminal domain-containing protein [Rhizomicrobium sp.]|jgi:hypothetical protein|nr:enhanced serine sensitivity protein SseB C-terminal domain-containing protein [Rhizomicrobium sp.]
MAFTPENELEAALVRAVQDPAAAAEFYRLLLESELLVLGTAEGREEATEKFNLESGNRLNLVTGEQDGRKYLPVFSSIARMQEYIKEDSKYLSMVGRDLFDTTRGAPLILNPASEYGKQLAPHEIAQLLDPGSAPRSEPMVKMGEADYPQDIVDTLTGVFRAHAGVKAAYMIRVTFADRAHEPHPLVGIEMEDGKEGEMRPLMEALNEAANRQIPGQVFDVQQIDRKGRAAMTDALLQVEPFYVRGADARTLN